MGDIVIVTGIVLSSMPIDEYDRRVVLLTRERGKISAFAKGSRRMNSQLMGITRTFAFGQFELYENRSSYDVKRAEIKQYFTDVSEDFEAVLYGYYFSELADYYGRENLAASQMINLLYVSLRALTKKAIPNELVRYIYELRLIHDNGECPDMFACALCQGEERLSAFSANNFGLVCQSCAGQAKDAIALTESCIYTLQYICSVELERLYTFTVSKEVLAELRMVMGRICSRVFGRHMKSLDILKSTVSS